MEYQQDWFMRQINMFIQFIAKALFKKDAFRYEILDPDNLSQTDLLYREIYRLLAEKKICEAENLLFDKLNTGELKHLELAIDFYQTLNQLSEEELESCNFSREEVNDGLNTVLRMFGMQHLLVYKT